jgi:hypothetical protein
MKTKVIFTEKQFDKIIKNLLEQSAPGVQQFQKGQYQSYKTDDYKATGTNLFKQGQDQIDERNPEIINLLSRVQQGATKSGVGGTTVTVNGGASNTTWGGSPAGSPEAVKKNTELATKRRDNLIKYLKSKVTGAFVTYVPGTVTVGKVGSKDPEKDQFVSVNISGKGTEGKINVDRDKTSIQYNTYPKKQKTGGGGGGGTPETQSRVATRVPTKFVSELKKVIYNWGKTKGLQLPISDKIVE